MKLLLIGLALLVLAAAVLGAKAKGLGASARGEPKARGALTKREQSMYFRLRDALPEHVVFGQVAFSALMTSRDRAVRNTFDRKVADFVVFDRAFQVAAVIELDDASHNGKRLKDAARDDVLSSLGYRVIRYDQIPDAERVKADFATPASVPIASTPPKGVESRPKANAE